MQRKYALTHLITASLVELFIYLYFMLPSQIQVYYYTKYFTDSCHSSAFRLILTALTGYEFASYTEHHRFDLYISCLEAISFYIQVGIL